VRAAGKKSGGFRRSLSVDRPGPSGAPLGWQGSGSFRTRPLGAYGVAHRPPKPRRHCPGGRVSASEGGTRTHGRAQASPTFERLARQRPVRTHRSRGSRRVALQRTQMNVFEPAPSGSDPRLETGLIEPGDWRARAVQMHFDPTRSISQVSSRSETGGSGGGSSIGRAPALQEGRAERCASPADTPGPTERKATN
jgi:hypothetical protein